MKKILLLTILALAGIQTITLSQGNELDDQLLLDDFAEERSATGTRWEGFSDRVMGGVSELHRPLTCKGR